MQLRTIRRFASPIALALAAGLVRAAQEPSAPPTVAAPPVRPSSEIVLAHVEGRPLTLDEAIRTFLSSHTGHGVLIRGEPAVRELAGRIVERELFLLEAEALGLADDPETVEIVTNYRRQLAGDEFWNREVKSKIAITDEDVESFYSKTDVALRLTLIEVATREAAEALLARVAAGEDMAALARTQSTHASRTFDGALPYVRRGELDRHLEDAVFALGEPKSITPVVATDTGFAFARLEERSVNPERPPRESALPQIRGILEERATKKLAKEVEERASADAGVWIDEAKLSRESVLDGPDATIVVARAAGDTLSLADVREALDLESIRSAPADTTTTIGIDLAKQWTRSEALMAAGAKAGLLDDPAIVEKARVFRRDVMMKFLCDRYVWPKEAPAEEDVRRYYEDRKTTDFATPPEARLAYIVLSTEADANDVLAALADGESFEVLARTRSKDSASSVHGGRIGWVKPGELLPQVETRAFALAAGAVDGPIETDVGFFVIKAIEVKPMQTVPYSMARETALARVVKARQLEAYNKWAMALRERATVELDEPGVADAVAWLEREALAREAQKAAVPKAAGNAPPGHGPAPRIPGVKAKTEEQKP